MKREKARKILGLAASASAHRARDAHAALRAHVEAREARAGGEAARASELRDVDAAREAWVGPEAESRETRPRAPGWMWAWAGLATLCTILLAIVLWRLTPQPASHVAETAPRTFASLRVPSALAGARLEVFRAGQGDVAATPILSVPADQQSHPLEPGAYRARVSHRDCPDAWEMALALEPGEERTLEAALCAETGWLQLNSVPPGEELRIDGKKRDAGQVEAHALLAGEHRVRIERQGFEPWEGRVRILPSEVLALRPELRQSKPEPTPAVAAPAPESHDHSQVVSTWHEQARQWLLARYDRDRSGALDSREELHSVPCEAWKGLARSHGAAGLVLPLTRFFGFDGEGFVPGALGVPAEVRDVAYERMQSCGLR